MDMTDGGKRVLRGADKALELLFYAAYALLIVVLMAAGAPQADSFPINPLLPARIIIPAAGLLIVSALRRAINAPRPYEVHGEKPILVKETHGRSFPSKHAFSSFMIALCWWEVSAPACAALLAAAALTSAIRVIGGVHFTRDVAAGAGIAFACAALLPLW